jgi:hypothetical protein
MLAAVTVRMPQWSLELKGHALRSPNNERQTLKEALILYMYQPVKACVLAHNVPIVTRSLCKVNVSKTNERISIKFYVCSLH